MVNVAVKTQGLVALSVLLSVTTAHAQRGPELAQAFSGAPELAQAQSGNPELAQGVPGGPQQNLGVQQAQIH